MALATTLVRLLLPARTLARAAGPHVLEATLGPTVCFLIGRAMWGVSGALALALGWTGACLALRHMRGRRASGLLLIGTTTLVLRAAISLAMHSERAFLVAPALVTIAMGVVYLASAMTSTPLLSRVVGDLLPASWIDIADPRAARLCRVSSAVWGAEQIISSVIALAMISHLSTTTYLMVHQMVSWLICLAVVALIVPFFWSDLRSLWAARRVGADQPGPTPPRAVITPPCLRGRVLALAEG